MANETDQRSYWRRINWRISKSWWGINRKGCGSKEPLERIQHLNVLWRNTKPLNCPFLRQHTSNGIEWCVSMNMNSLFQSGNRGWQQTLIGMLKGLILFRSPTVIPFFCNDSIPGFRASQSVSWCVCNSLCVPKKNALRPAPFSVDEIQMKGLAFINIQWRCIASLNVPLIDYYI